MAIRDLVSFLKKRASGVQEVLDTMGFDDSTIDRAIQIPVTRSMRTQREEVLDWFEGRRAFEDAHILEDETAIEYLVLDDYF